VAAARLAASARARDDYLGVTDWSKFDALFHCPDAVIDQDLRDSYQQLYVQAKTECEGLDMSSAQIMRTSVMLAWYYKHLQTSRVTYGDKGGYQHPGQEKDALLAWEQIARGWDDVRQRSKPRADGLSPEKVRDVFVTVLAEVDEPALRALLQDKFVEALSTA
jgi:hypothetical protein